MSNRSFRIALSIALPLIVIGAAAKPKPQIKPSRYVYVWSGNAMKDKKGMEHGGGDRRRSVERKVWARDQRAHCG
jgi:hypothetical protein